MTTVACGPLHASRDEGKIISGKENMKTIMQATCVLTSHPDAMYIEKTQLNNPGRQAPALPIIMRLKYV